MAAKKRARKQSRAKSSKNSAKQLRANFSKTKKTKRKYTRRATTKVTEPGLPVPNHLKNLPEAMRDVPQRMLILNEAAKLTGVDHNAIFGDPLFTFSGIANLKKAFWDSIHPVADRAYESGDAAEDPRKQNSPTGHAIDMILMGLGRLATSPNQQIRKEELLNLAAHTAILYEAAARQGQLSGE